MRLVDVGKLFGGSCAVYFVVAACSAAYSDQGQGPAATPSGTSPQPTSPSPIDPVPNAMADGYRSGSRLKLRFWEGADGSRNFIDFFDTTLQTNCAIHTKTSDGKTRCLPVVTGTLYYGDAQCKTPAVYVVSKTADPQPKVAALNVYVQNASPYQDHYTLKGLVNPPATVYRGDFENGPGGGGGCSTATTVPAGQNYYEVGAPLPPTSFVEMTIKTE